MVYGLAVFSCVCAVIYRLAKILTMMDFFYGLSWLL